MNEKPVIVAHRGLSSLYPENTYLAIERAIHHGARAVEFDIQLTADKVPVLFHDVSLQRMTGQAGKIMETAWDRLENFQASFPGRFADLFESNPIISLEGIMAIFVKNPQVTPCLEIKKESLECFGLKTCIDAILEASGPVRDRGLYLSFSREAIEYIHTLGLKKTGWVLETYDDDHRIAAEELRPQVLIIDIKKLPETGQISWQGDYEWMVYRTEDPEVVKKYAKMGIEYIETDNVKVIADSLPELF